MERYPDPFAHFDAWFAEARDADPQPEAAALATAAADRRPSNRMVLSRRSSSEGFEVYTDLESRKAGELRDNPAAALVWYWKPLGRQVRAEGRVSFLGEETVDAYWYARPRGSQLSATTSHQSQPVESRAALLARLAAVEAEHAKHETVPRPARWGGVRLVPDRVEFWIHDPGRLHDRLEYRREADGTWTTRVLQP